MARQSKNWLNSTEDWLKQQSHLYLVAFVAIFAVAGTAFLLTSYGATPATTGTRNPLVQPFTSTSIWNMPIGSGAVYVPSQIAPPTIAAMTNDPTNIMMTPSDPLTPIDQGPQAQTGNRCTTGGAVLVTVPIPASLVIANDSHNSGFAAVGSDGSSLYEGGRFARCTAGQPATASDAKAEGTIFGDGVSGASGGSSLSVLGGVLRMGDLAPGTETRHALSVNIDGETDLWPGSSSTSCFVWPSTKCDSYGTTRYGGKNPALRMGALLAIPQNLNLSSLGLKTQAGQELAWTLQNYGGYVVNDAARSVFTIRTEEGANSFTSQFQSEYGFPFETTGVAGSSDWATDVMTIISHLDVITNNSANSIGGGGTPLQTLAAPLGTGTTQGNPTISITSPTDGATVTGKVAFSAAVTDSQPISQVAFYAGSNSLGTVSSSPYSLSWDSTSVADGSTTLKAIVTDKTGQSATSTITVMVNNNSTPPPPPPPPPPTTTETVKATADTYASSAFPTADNSRSTDLRTNSSPTVRSFLKFNVQVKDTITKAVLRVYAIQSSGASYTVRGIGNSWQAATLNYHHMPSLGTKLGTSGTFSANKWTSVNVTSAVDSSGTYSFALLSDNNKGAIYDSSNAKSDQPQLVITYGCGDATSDGDTNSSCTKTPAPLAPTNLVATVVSATKVNLTWTASTSPNIVHYNIYRNNLPVASSTGTSYSDTGTLANTTYTYDVTAVDTTPQESPPSNTSTVTTPTVTDNTPPTAPTGLTGTVVTSSQINLKWTASTDKVAVAGYYVFRDGTKVATVTVGTTYGDTALSANTTYTYYVEAFNVGNLTSAPSSTISVTIPATSPPPPPPGGPCAGTAAPTYQHVIWIVFENKGYKATVGSGASTYWTQLSEQCSNSTAAYGITHPSLPNYIAAVSGSTQGVTTDGYPVESINAPSIFDAAISSGKTWKSYQESMPSNCFGSVSGNYYPKHGPAVYFSNDKAACAQDDVPMGTTTGGAFLSDVNNNTLPNFAEVTPNICDDMHDCSVQIGDAWLETWMTIILASPSYKAGNTAVFIMMDESLASGENNQVPFVVVAPSVKPKTIVTTHIDHYDILRTTEALLGITPYPGAANTAQNLSSSFNL